MEDLCRDRPLEGDYLNLFQAIERSETSMGTDHVTAENEVKVVARTHSGDIAPYAGREPFERPHGLFDTV